MISTDEIQETIDSLTVKPYNSQLLVLTSTPSEATESGILKGDELMAQEAGKGDAFLTVVGVAAGIQGIKPGDRVYVQGEVVILGDDIIPPELDIAPEGYSIAMTNYAYVKLVSPID